jgi:hypothetical protein
MALASSRGIDFENCRARTGPMTWGQQWFWEKILHFGEHHNELNFMVWSHVETNSHIDHVLASIKELVERNEILRTKFRTKDSSAAYQQVPQRGQFTVHLVEESTEGDKRNPTDLVTRIMREPFSFEHEVSVRFVVMLRCGSPVKVALIFCHLAADGWSAMTLARELEDLMGTSSQAWLNKDKAARPQAIDQAHWEASANGLRRSERSLTFAERQLLNFPSDITETLPGGLEDPPVQEVSMRSQALDVALRNISGLYEVSVSDALLFTICAGLAEIRQNDMCGLLLYVSNRYSSMRNPALGPVVQDVPVALSVRDPLPAALKTTAAVARAAYLRGQYSPPAMQELVYSTFRSRTGGAPNKLNMELSNSGRPDLDISLDDIKTMQEATSIRRTKGQTRDGIRHHFFLTGRTVGDAVEVALKVDTEKVSVAAAESFLQELEERSINYSRVHSRG